MKTMATASRAHCALVNRVAPALGQVRHSSSSSATAAAAAPGELKKTALYDYHVRHGGKMVPFAGYQMPVQYSGQSLVESHHFTRRHASLFDVSHMVQHTFRGADAAAFLERVTPSACAAAAGPGGLGLFQSRLTAFLWPGTGGIVDDAVVTRVGEDSFFVVTNGACRDKDARYLDEQLGRFGGRVEWTLLEGAGLFAVQGPQAAEIMARVLLDKDKDGGDAPLDLASLHFGKAAVARIKLSGDGGGGGLSSSLSTFEVLVSRGGYTGEDGFEVSIQDSRDGADANAGIALGDVTVSAVSAVMQAGNGRLQLAGLGARDSLRLEAGMCLYGHDLDDTVTPVEAGLSWIIPKERRGADAGFHGAEVIARQLTAKSKGGGMGVDRRRVGLVMVEEDAEKRGPPAREGALLEKDGDEVGVVTSGMPSPSLGVNIAMGYVRDGLHKQGTEVEVVVRGRRRRAVVTKMPFIETHYWKG